MVPVSLPASRIPRPHSSRWYRISPCSIAIASSTAEWLGKVAKRLKNPLWRKLYTLRGETDIEQVLQWINQLDLMAEKMRQNVDLVLFGAPVLLFFHADKTMRSADVNATLALHNATMLASSLGLGSFYTGYVVTACSHDNGNTAPYRTAEETESVWRAGPRISCNTVFAMD